MKAWLADRLAAETQRKIVVALLAVTCVCILVPLSPEMPGPQLDESWALGMNEALSQGLSFGEDILFTFGPYSGVFSTQYHPGTDLLMLFASACLAACYAFVLAALTRERPRYLGWLLIALLAGLLSERDARDTLLLSYPLLAAIVCVVRTRGDDRGTLVTVGVASSVWGLLALIKGSMAVACGLIGAVVLVHFALERRWRSAIVVVASPLVSLIAFWLLAGQSFAGLVGYVRSLFPIVSGYAEAMAIPGDPLDIAFYLAGSAVVIGAILRERDVTPRTKYALAAMFAAYLFMAFKAGFVRHDAHALIPAQSLLFATIVLSGILHSRARLVAIVTAIVAWAYIDHHYIGTTPITLIKRTASTYANAAEGLGDRAFGDGPRARFDDRMARIGWNLGTSQLPGTTDVYSFDQTVLLASGQRWSPRPMFQSYAAYNSFLAEANRAHLLSERAPDNVLFRIAAFDARLPPLDDGPSLPVLLERYRPTAFEREFVILRKRDAIPTVTREVLETSTKNLARSIKLPPADGIVFARIGLGPSLLGKLAGALYKTNTLLITLELANGQTRTYRYVSGMGQAGFILSPLVETTRELTALFAGPGNLDAKRVKSFSITPAGTRRFWSGSFDLTFEQLRIPPALTPRQHHDFAAADQPITPVHGTYTDLPAIPCEGVVDRINGFTGLPSPLHVSGLIEISGWAAHSIKEGRVPSGVHIVLTDAAGKHTTYRTRASLRADVVSYYNEPRLEPSGYAATIDVSRLGGSHTIGLAFQDGDRLELCSNFKAKLEIKAVD